MPSAFDHRLGRLTKFQIQRFGNAGAFLAEAGGEANAPTILLLGPEIPEGARPGDELEAFVYLDSEGRPLATTQTPKLALGEVDAVKRIREEKRSLARLQTLSRQRQPQPS